MRKIVIKLYPETARWLRKADLVDCVLEKLNIRSMGKEDVSTRSLTLTEEEYQRMKRESWRRGESVSMMFNEQVIQLGRKLMGEPQKKTDDNFVIYLDRMLKMYPSISDWETLIDICWRLYYVPEDIDRVYLLTDRMSERALNIAGEVMRKNFEQTRPQFYVMPESEFKENMPKGVKTYVERPQER